MVYITYVKLWTPQHGIIKGVIDSLKLHVANTEKLLYRIDTSLPKRGRERKSLVVHIS